MPLGTATTKSSFVNNSTESSGLYAVGKISETSAGWTGAGTGAGAGTGLGGLGLVSAGFGTTAGAGFTGCTTSSITTAFSVTDLGASAPAAALPALARGKLSHLFERVTTASCATVSVFNSFGVGGSTGAGAATGAGRSESWRLSASNSARMRSTSRLVYVVCELVEYKISCETESYMMHTIHTRENLIWCTQSYVVRRNHIPPVTIA
jgi:hypothetical protein